MRNLVLKGTYQITAPLKETDRAFIFLGQILNGNTSLVIKILKERYVRKPDFIERYTADLQTTANLPEHPNLVRIFDVDYISQRYCVVSEFFEGTPLSEPLVSEGALPYGRILAIVRQLALVMGFAYREGLPHRHVEMDNVLYDEKSGTLKVLKFTTPRSAKSGPRGPLKRSSGMGADLYLLGVTLFRLFCKTFPFKTRQDLPEIEVDRLKKRLTADYTELSADEVHALANLFVRTTSRDVEKRLRSFDEFLKELDGLEERNADIVQAKTLQEKEKKKQSLETAFDTVAALQGRLPAGPAPLTREEARAMVAGSAEEILAGSDEAIRRRLVWHREPQSRLSLLLAEEGFTITLLLIFFGFGLVLCLLYFLLS